MSDTVAGLVKNGVVVPNAPLPEGSFVEVRVISGPVEVPPELQEELEGWQRAGANALELVERLAQEMEANEKGRSLEGTPSDPTGARPGGNAPGSHCAG